jgi:hypothetical protein
MLGTAHFDSVMGPVTTFLRTLFFRCLVSTAVAPCSPFRGVVKNRCQRV